MLKKDGFLMAAWLLLAIPGIAFTAKQEITFPKVEGMTIETNYPDYTGEDLWDYINGAADGYLAYHFEKLKIAEYKDKAGRTIKVEVYKHRRPEDAYGIYSMERSPDYHFIKIGAEGYSESGLVNFVTGRYYVKVTAKAGEKESGENLLNVARAVCESLDKNPSLPPVLSVFPPDGRLPHSEVFISTNVLGNEFLKDAFKADYETGGKSFSVIIFKRESNEECINILKAYYNYTGEEPPADWKDGPYVVNDKYNGTIHLYLRDKVLFGFLNLEDKALIDQMTGEILKSI
jgi:hypothetical protein